jgi:hypothetical protein
MDVDLRWILDSLKLNASCPPAPATSFVTMAEPRPRPTHGASSAEKHPASPRATTMTTSSSLVDEHGYDGSLRSVHR